MRFDLSKGNNHRLLREAIEENLAEFAAEKGIKIKTGNIRFQRDGTGCKVQLEVSAPDESGEITSEEKKDWVRYAQAFFGLNPEWLGCTFTHGYGPTAKSLEIIGLLPSRRKFPVLVRDKATGKQLIVAASEVIEKLTPRRSS